MNQLIKICVIFLLSINLCLGGEDGENRIKIDLQLSKIEREIKELQESITNSQSNHSSSLSGVLQKLSQLQNDLHEVTIQLDEKANLSELPTRGLSISDEVKIWHESVRTTVKNYVSMSTIVVTAAGVVAALIAILISGISIYYGREIGQFREKSQENLNKTNECTSVIAEMKLNIENTLTEVKSSELKIRDTYMELQPVIEETQINLSNAKELKKEISNTAKEINELTKEKISKEALESAKKVVNQNQITAYATLAQQGEEWADAVFWWRQLIRTDPNNMDYVVHFFNSSLAYVDKNINRAPVKEYMTAALKYENYIKGLMANRHNLANMYLFYYQTTCDVNIRKELRLKTIAILDEDSVQRYDVYMILYLYAADVFSFCTDDVEERKCIIKSAIEVFRKRFDTTDDSLSDRIYSRYAILLFSYINTESDTEICRKILEDIVINYKRSITTGFNHLRINALGYALIKQSVLFSNPTMLQSAKDELQVSISTKSEYNFGRCYMAAAYAVNNEVDECLWWLTECLIHGAGLSLRQLKHMNEFDLLLKDGKFLEQLKRIGIREDICEI